MACMNDFRAAPITYAQLNSAWLLFYSHRSDRRKIRLAYNLSVRCDHFPFAPKVCNIWAFVKAYFFEFCNPYTVSLSELDCLWCQLLCLSSRKKKGHLAEVQVNRIVKAAALRVGTGATGSDQGIAALSASPCQSCDGSRYSFTWLRKRWSCECATTATFTRNRLIAPVNT